MYKNIDGIVENYEARLAHLNYANGMVVQKHIIAQLMCDFDYDMNGYEKGRDQYHFFTGAYSLSGITNKVYDVKVGDIYFATDNMIASDAFINQKAIFQEEHFYVPSADEVLTESLMIDPEYRDIDLHPDLDEYFFENSTLDSSNFKFTKFEIIGLDNVKSEIKYHGTLYGDSYGLNTVENRQAYMQLSLECTALNLPFYKELLLDAYSHYQSSNYKMCAFLAFTAFESFINITSDLRYQNDSSAIKPSEEKDSLLNKFIEVFKSKQVDEKNFNTFDSFAKLKTFFNSKQLTKTRNAIAHGTEDYCLWKYNEGEVHAKNIYVFTSLVILCYENSLKDLNAFERFMKNLNLAP